MVLIKLLSLSKNYIQESNDLVTILDQHNFNVKSAFWCIKYSENEKWYDGEWILLIESKSYATVGARETLSYIQNTLKNFKNLKLDDICVVDSLSKAEYNLILDKIIIK